MSAFDHLIRYLSRPSRTDSNQQEVTIAEAEYQIFCKEYLFDNLKEVSFGKAFCKRFDITDYVLDLLPTENSARKHITTVGYISDTDSK